MKSVYAFVLLLTLTNSFAGPTQTTLVMATDHETVTLEKCTTLENSSDASCELVKEAFITDDNINEVREELQATAKEECLKECNVISKAYGNMKRGVKKTAFKSKKAADTAFMIGYYFYNALKYRVQEDLR